MSRVGYWWRRGACITCLRRSVFTEGVSPALLGSLEALARAATDLIMTSLDEIEIDKEADIQGFDDGQTDQLARLLAELKWQDVYLAVSRIPLRRYSRK